MFAQTECLSASQKAGADRLVKIVSTELLPQYVMISQHWVIPHVLEISQIGITVCQCIILLSKFFQAFTHGSVTWVLKDSFQVTAFKYS